MVITPKAVLFDLDNTILAFDTAGDKARQHLCEKFAPRVDGLESAVLLQAINEARDRYWQNPDLERWGRLNIRIAQREIVSAAFARLSIDASHISDEIADEYSVLREELVEPFPGAIEALKYLLTLGTKLGLVTQGQPEFQRPKIERFGLAPLFVHILIEGEFGVGKPDKRVFLHSLEQLEVEARDAWMVGDHLTNDVQGAQKVGIKGIWVDWRGSGLPETAPVKPDRIIQAISELTELR